MSTTLLIGQSYRWSFETVRYFGAKHAEIKMSRVVCLRPREIPDDVDLESDGE